MFGFALAAMLPSAGAFGLGRREPEPVQVGDRVELVGTVDIYGNEPRSFPGLLIDLDENAGFVPTPAMRNNASVGGPDDTAPGARQLLLRMSGEMAAALGAMPGRMVRVICTLDQDAVGPGFPAVIEIESYAIENR